MERSIDRNLKAYEFLAYYYDELLGDEESLSFWLEEIEKEKFETALELASGSGLMAKILKNKGYKVTASDISKDMKEASKINFDGEYLILNMSNYHINKSYDLILSICDSINYLNIEELESFIKCSKEHLNKNGRLIFDMHNIKRLEEFDEEYIEEGDLHDIQYQWTIKSDIDTSSLHEHFTFYTSDGMIQEQHLQFVHKPEIVIRILEKYGFKVNYIEDFIKDEKVLMVARI